MGKFSSSVVPFCYIPWIHSHVDIFGKRKLCCVSDEIPDQDARNEKNFEAFWNGPYMRNLRMKMISHDKPDECSSCWKNLQSTVIRKDNIQKEYGHLNDVFLRNTQDDGSYHKGPLYFDYRIGNKCNFSCRMCDSFSSSSIKRLEVKAGLGNAFMRNERNDEELYEELVRLTNNQEIKKIYFAAGEPFLSERNWRYFDEMTDLGLAHTISLKINTNLSVISFKGIPLWEKLKSFRGIELIASIDSVGEVGEFIRSGFQWAKWQDNLRKWVDVIGKDNISFNITVSIPCLLDIKNFIPFLDKIRVNYRLAICYNQGWNSILSPLSLDRKLLNTIIEQAKVYIPQNDPYFLGFTLFLEDLNSKELLSEAHDNWKAILKDSFDYYVSIDLKRKGIKTVNWYYENEMLRPWILKILNYVYGILNEEIHRPFLENFFINDRKTDNYAYIQRLSLTDHSLFFNYEFHKLPDADSFIKEYFQSMPGLSLIRLSVIDFSITPFHRLLNLFNQKRVFNKKNMYCNGKENLAMPTLYFDQMIYKLASENFEIRFIHKSHVPLNTSQIFRRRIFQTGLMGKMLSKLGKKYPNLFSIHCHWVFDIKKHS